MKKIITAASIALAFFTASCGKVGTTHNIYRVNTPLGNCFSVDRVKAGDTVTVYRLRDSTRCCQKGARSYDGAFITIAIK